jgi:hypothetical protein
MRLEAKSGHPLSRCHGYLVIADNGWLGDVETPLFGSDAGEPDYLVVRTHVEGRARRALVPASLVSRVDVEDALVHVRGSVWELSRFPSSLPAAPSSPLAD